MAGGPLSGPASPPPQTTIWRRRAILMAIVGLVLAVPIVVAIGASDDGDGAAPRAAPRLPLNAAVVDRSLGVTYRVPKGWSGSSRAGTVQLRSPNRSVQVGISAPAPASGAAAVLRAALDDLRATYARVTVTPGSGKRVGGLPVRGAVVSARTRDRTDLRVLVAVARGGDLSHLVEVFTAEGAPTRAVAQAQRALDALRFTR